MLYTDKLDTHLTLQMHCFFIFYLYIHIIFVECVENTGVCQRRNQTGGVEDGCCDNFEPKHEDQGKCQECPPGSTSMRGLPCSVCPDNYYGAKCSNHCVCLSSDICDKVKGCVLKTKINIVGTSSAMLETNTRNRGLNHQTTTGSPLTDENKGLMTKKTLLIYIMSTGLCVVSIGLFVFCRKRGTQICYRLKWKQKTSDNSKCRFQAVNEDSLSRSDIIYDLIDDQHMLDDPERNG
ncbi:uncharacterized protein LOC127732582 isoform X2 [Mytilus californianus]|uniref:uncharacterized protein LOC127732582 isoform X2 n=1 Tax=Mytilus californianus TaxID=6549 RepID=UPI002247D036|nr:uncharacterized protein LOC127732582 isoform X2 [Mytilus californianus]